MKNKKMTTEVADIKKTARSIVSDTLMNLQYCVNLIKDTKTDDELGEALWETLDVLDEDNTFRGIKGLMDELDDVE